ncbi:MAG: 50S ribosomal protein L22 [Candidatus Magasanikbacteria bacterium CG10_big_fil_rev_8_21_14_0_10_36_32]|uniref:Large ribosomal subunit protein uL22 n=1 Tax=Candidatus Magasanikbacteria bacterium CG10_big_fil_rev_8_21_14_0_10_36_32 TaxID=1974646 RepID=A0A2M6W6N9_9BACT|nr:MAG: 50S ribosomal protein L22 [Candidatus Magasanikbacteria bacterium CG10_big_fil_rev_8_21_14_0_10_36_32]
MQEVKAKLSFLRMGPRKVRLVADLMRGRKVSTAIDRLSLMNKKAARYLLKLLKSAVANAKNNFQLEVDNLRVKSITVDGGPVLKRWMPKAHGRATPIRERTSHINLVLIEEKVEAKKVKTKKVEAKKVKTKK